MRTAVGTGTVLSRLRASTWLVLEWARRDASLRYRETALGLAWVLVQPAGLLAVYGVVLVRVLDVGMSGRQYVLFAGAGLVLWTFVSSCLSRATTSVLSAQSLIGRVYFPREVIPLAIVLATLPDLALTGAVLLVLQVVLGSGLHLSAVAVPLVLLGLVLLVAACSVALSVVGVFLRDLGHALPFALQLLFFATPVVYPAERVPDDLRWAVDLNPLAVSLEAFRDSFVDGRWPSTGALLTPLVLGLLLLLLALRYVRAVEQRLPDAL